MKDTGEEETEETYDPNSIANVNPFRYRGYFFDQETGLYYLNSRYYDPELGRFISPDTLSIIDETKGQINGLNLYMYCGNNPVMNVDPSGKFFLAFLACLAITAACAVAGAAAGAVVGAAVGLVSALVTGQDIGESVLMGMAIGATIGGAIGLCLGGALAASVAIGTIAGVNAITSVVIAAKALCVLAPIAVGVGYAVGSNLGKGIESRHMVSKYGDIGYGELNFKPDDKGNYTIDQAYLTDDKSIMMCVNYMYETDENIRNNWTKEELYRELKYHKVGWEHLLLKAIFYKHLEEADVELKQTGRTYIFRAIGNLFW